MENQYTKKIIYLTDVANFIDTLNLIVVQECQHLKIWETAKGEIVIIYVESLEKARKNLEVNGTKWNEEELKMKFISLVISASEVEETNKIAVFYERACMEMNIVFLANMWQQTLMICRRLFICYNF